MGIHCGPRGVVTLLYDAGHAKEQQTTDSLKRFFHTCVVIAANQTAFLVDMMP